jgi:predicted DNA-binding transcriptional regulator YafY
MSNTGRVYQIDQILAARQFVTREELMERLEVSWATLKRDLAYMRDRLNAPIIFDRELGGYRFEDNDGQVGPQYELPGLWFDANEIHALLTMQHLLSNLDTGGLLGPHVQPLLARLTGILGTADNAIDEIEKRIKIDTAGARHFELDHFQAIGAALLQRKRMNIQYHARGTDEVTEREISPQRLIYYKHNWYLDAWCHLRNALRSFSVDAVLQAEILETNARNVSEKNLNETLGAGYGIFSGKHAQWATLHFSAERARWVATEQWHPKQKAAYLDNGKFELQIPYADDRELVMDILRHGGDCEVISPPELRQRVKLELKRVSKFYTKD